MIHTKKTGTRGKSGIGLGLAGLTGVLLSLPALGDPITLTNPDFDESLGQLGWVIGSKGKGSGQFFGTTNLALAPFGSFQQNLKSYTTGDANGDDSDGSIEQVLGDTFVAGAEYTLAASVAARQFVYEDFTAEATLTLEVFDSVTGDVLASGSHAIISQASGPEWTPITAVGTAGVANAGNPIGIRLVSEITNLPGGTPGQVEVKWDAVSLDGATGVGASSVALVEFGYDPLDGASEISITGGDPNTRYKLVAAGDLDFDNPDQDPVPLLVATAGTLSAGGVITDGSGNATVQFNLGTTSAADFIRAEIHPPVEFWSENFEDDDGSFTSMGTPNDWEYGNPNSDNGIGSTVTAGNGGGKCWGTNLGDGGADGGFIDTNADSILRSPSINLTGISGAELEFAAAIDATAGDIFEVHVREVGTDQLLATLYAPSPPDDDEASAPWVDFGPFELSAADNMNIYLEFRFQGTDNTYLGVYIDDLVIRY